MSVAARIVCASADNNAKQTLELLFKVMPDLILLDESDAEKMITSHPPSSAKLAIIGVLLVNSSIDGYTFELAFVFDSTILLVDWYIIRYPGNSPTETVCLAINLFNKLNRFCDPLLWDTILFVFVSMLTVPAYLIEVLL